MPCYLALFARISCNTFLESLKHFDQPWVGFVDGTKYLIKNCLSLCTVYRYFRGVTRMSVDAVSEEADLKGGSSMTRGKSLSLVNDQDS